MMMPAQPMAAFKIVQPKLFFKLPVVELDAPTGVCQAHQPAHSRGGAFQMRQPVLSRLFAIGGPLDQQPFSDSFRMLLFAPAMCRPDFQQRETRALAPFGSFAPDHFAPGCGRKLLRYRTESLWSWKRRQRRILPAPASGVSLFKRDIRIACPDYCSRFYRHDIIKLPGAQLPPKIKIIAVKRIRQHRESRHLPVQHLINQLKRQLSLTLIYNPGRRLDPGQPLRIIYPLPRQVKTPAQRATYLSTAPMQNNRHFTICDLTQRTAVLTGNPDGMLSSLRKRSLIQNPNF